MLTKANFRRSLFLLKSPARLIRDLIIALFASFKSVVADRMKIKRLVAVFV